MRKVMLEQQNVLAGLRGMGMLAGFLFKTYLKNHDAINQVRLICCGGISPAQFFPRPSPLTPLPKGEG